MIPIFYFTFALFFYYLILLKSKDVLHPLGIGILLWFFSAGIANMGQFYSASQSNLSILTNLVIFLAGFFYIFSFIFSRNIKKEDFVHKKLIFSNNFKFIFNFFLLLSILNFFLRFSTCLLSPPFFSSDGFTDVKTLVPPALPFINLFDVSMSFFAIVCFFEYKFSHNITKKRKILLISYIVFFIVVTIFYKVSRGEFIAFALGALYLNSVANNKKINFKKIIYGLFFVFLFFYIGLNRISQDSLVSSHFGDGILNIVFSQIYTYTAMNFQNLNKLIISNVEPTYFWGAFKFILSPFFSSEYKNNSIGFVDFETEFFNAKTYIYYFYHDLRVVGVMFYSLAIGFFIQMIYNFSIKNFKFFVLIACLMKPIFFMFFGNYFFGETVLTLPYFLVLILILFIRPYNAQV